MKFLIVMLIAIYSFSSFAIVNLKLELDISEEKITTNKNIEFDEKQSIKLKDGKMDYILSSKKPSNYPSDYLWDKKSIHLKVEIFDSRGNLISSPDVSTVLGKTATFEEFGTKNATKPSIKMGFTATSL